MDTKPPAPPVPPRQGGPSGPGSRLPQATQLQAPSVRGSTEMLAELVTAQRQVSQMAQESADLRGKLGRRTHQMSVLQHLAEILAATPKMAQLAQALQEVFVQEFGARRCVVWVMEDAGAKFVPRTAHGVPRSGLEHMHLPMPNPFPGQPIMLFQNQWLDAAALPAGMEALKGGDGSAFYFVPFEYQLLLMGFAILAVDKGRKFDDSDLDSLSLLQKQAASSLYNAWLFRDIQEQRDKLQRQAVELEAANTALREADRFKSEFLALTSHELRTPLTGILGFTRLVLEGLFDDEAEMRQLLQDSYVSGQHLLDLLNDILDLAKIESGRLEIHPEPFSLGVLLEEVHQIAEGYPKRPGVVTIWPMDLQDLPEVMVDPYRLKQVFLNVLSNAFKFTREGSVRVGVERFPGRLQVQVVDTGIGVAPEAQKNLFQKFVQAEGGHSREYGGTGLGLVICRHLMEMMGGSIELYSEGSGKGTTMTLSVQIA
ncbi:MAG: HAMP domain-containing histidine kinase [Acidobacteria bacterium]|nr:HAMP domain-containing histidine kinase [Acidobacteriota bacterium]